MDENKEQKYELLVDNILDIIVELDLALLINDSVNELQGVAKSRNQEIILNIHEKLITKFENERINEVIGNLLTNAIKYSPPSNSIVIK